MPPGPGQLSLVLQKDPLSNGVRGGPKPKSYPAWFCSNYVDIHTYMVVSCCNLLETKFKQKAKINASDFKYIWNRTKIRYDPDLHRTYKRCHFQDLWQVSSAGKDSRTWGHLVLFQLLPSHGSDFQRPVSRGLLCSKGFLCPRVRPQRGWDTWTHPPDQLESYNKSKIISLFTKKSIKRLNHFVTPL